jgi:hypothetical protein
VKTGHSEPGYRMLKRSKEMVSGTCPYYVVLQVCDNGILCIIKSLKFPVSSVGGFGTSGVEASGSATRVS